jgi:hypothetical protein
VVLTAKHILEDDPPADGFTIGGPRDPGTACSAALERQWLHPEVDVDVAVATLTRPAADAFGRAAYDSSLVATADDWNLLDDDVTMICGYPAGYRGEEVDHDRKTILHILPGVTHATTVAPDLDARGRYRVEWGPGIMEDPDGKFQFLGIEDGKERDLAHPGGISGGPLWRVRGPISKSEIWIPDKMARIVGVASRYLEGIEFAPSVKVWGDWFREVIAEVDKYANPQAVAGAAV